MLSHFPPGLSMWPALSNGKIHSHSEFISLDHCLVLALSHFIGSCKCKQSG